MTTLATIPRVMRRRLRQAISLRMLIARIKHFAVLLFVGLLVTDVFATDWPRLSLPTQIQTFPIGTELVVNGMPMQLRGFTSTLRASELLDAFRQSLGQPLVESVIGDKKTLGRAQGNFYITVQVDGAANANLHATERSGSSGTLSISDLASYASNHEQQKNKSAALLNRLPAGSIINSQMQSEEKGAATTYLVISNPHSEQFNRDALLQMMKTDGYLLEKEFAPKSEVREKLPSQMENATTLLFRGTGREAMAMIAKSDGKTAIVLQTSVNLKGDQ